MSLPEPWGARPSLAGSLPPGATSPTSSRRLCHPTPPQAVPVLAPLTQPCSRHVTPMAGRGAGRGHLHTCLCVQTPFPPARALMAAANILPLPLLDGSDNL